MSDSAVMESVLKRDRAIVLTALVGVVAIAWIYLANFASNMRSLTAVELMEMTQWTAVNFVLMFFMWAVMMVGMMIPSAAPSILHFARLRREKMQQGETYAPTAVFVLGYLTVWIIFSLVAVILQWILNSLALLSPTMVSTSPILGGLILIATGIFHWTPIHHNFLARCRNPLEILKRRASKGTNAFITGLENGANCLGCCSVMMFLLFVGGVMNLIWVALISVFIFAEKVLPYGDLCGRWSAIPLALAGLAVITFDLKLHEYAM